MIGAIIARPGSKPDPERFARSLGLFAEAPAAFVHPDIDRALFRLLHPRRRGPVALHVEPGPDGTVAVLSGWLDNADELRARLGLPPQADDATVYAHAIAGPAAHDEECLTGFYAAIALLPDGRVRMARSPWGGPSLFWARQGGTLLAASIPRPLFASGLPKRLRADGMERMARHDAGDPAGTAYEGLFRVAQGTIVEFDTGGGHRTNSWYDPYDRPIASSRLSPDDSAAAATRLLDEAAARTVARCPEPGLLLSGGLDSPLVAAALLRALPEPQRLPSFTAVPVSMRNIEPLPAMFADEESRVRAFAALHPRLDPHFVSPEEGGFLDLLDRFLLATDTAYPSHALSAFYHAPFAAAAQAGCDCVLTADAGNRTFSEEARWAYGEFARTGRWAELMRMLDARPDDPRPLWRKALALSVLPQLPRRVAAFVRSVAHPEHGDDPALLSRPGPRFEERSRRDAVRRFWDGCDRGAEVFHGFEQVFGITQRDVSLYRPLVEFCLSLPTTHFVKGGITRRLARRMGEGIIPPAQLGERRFGQHNPDWHGRMSRELPRYRAAIAEAGEQPALARLFDLDRARALLDAWPAAPPPDPDRARTLFYGLNAIAIAARTYRHATGSNR